MAKTFNFSGFSDEALRDSFIFGLKDGYTLREIYSEKRRVWTWTKHSNLLQVWRLQNSTQICEERQFSKYGVNRIKVLYMWKKLTHKTRLSLRGLRCRKSRNKGYLAIVNCRAKSDPMEDPTT